MRRTYIGVFLSVLLIGVLALPLSAFGDSKVTYTASSVETVLAPQKNPVSLGSLQISFGALDKGEHVAAVALPEGFNIAAPGFMLSEQYPFVKMEATTVGLENQFRLVIDHDDDVSPVSFKVPIKTTVPAKARGEISLKITGEAGQFSDGEVVVGRVPGGRIEITAPVAKVKAHQNEAAYTIRVSEDQDGVLGADEAALTLTLPTGFKWDPAVDVKMVREGRFLAVPVVDAVDGRVMTVGIEDTGRRFAGAFELSGRVLFEDGLPAGGVLQVEVQGTDLTNPVSLRLARFVAADKEARFFVGRTDYMADGSMYSMDVAPYLKDGRLFLPLRFVGLSLGVDPDKIKWDGGTATITLGDKSVRAGGGSKVLMVNGSAKQMDTAAEIKQGRMMLPYRFIAEAFGASVRWDETSRSVWMEL